MAEDPKAPETPEEKKPTTKEKDKPAVDMVPKARLDEQIELVNQYKTTLAALQQERERARAIATTSPGDIADLATAIAKELNVTVDDVRPHLALFDRAFSVREQQYMGILNAMADKIDYLEARTTFPDYADYEKDIDAERQRRLERNQGWISRRESYDIVRGRRLPDLLAKEREKAATGSLPDNGDTVTETKAGPTPGRGHLPSPADLKSMSPAERLKVAEELGEF